MNRKAEPGTAMVPQLVRLPPPFKARLRAYAYTSRVREAEIIRMALDEFLKARGA